VSLCIKVVHTVRVEESKIRENLAFPSSSSFLYTLDVLMLRKLFMFCVCVCVFTSFDIV
jgi:hypothetical protein